MLMQDLTQFSTYLFTLVIAALLPGPGMTGLMLKTFTQGYQRALLMLLGLITGDVLFLLSSIFLIDFIHQLSPHFSFYMMLLCSVYLLYLSYRYWNFQDDLFNENTQILDIKTSFSAYQEGLLMTLSNPKTISFYLALVPIIFGSASLQEKTITLIGLTVLTLFTVGGLYIFAALKIKKLLNNKWIERILLKSLALMMCVLALAMLYKELHVFVL